MNVAVFGATGKTGRLVVEDCLKRGWGVRAFVRDKGKAKFPPHAGLQLVQGDARTLGDVRQAVQGTDAVFCCLGMHDITVPATDFSESVGTIVTAMTETGVPRLIAIASGLALDDPSGGYRAKHGYPEFLKHVIPEHLRNHETLRTSRLEWTLMCPLTLVDDIPFGHGKFAYEDLPGGSGETGYADLAATMVQLVDKPESFRKRVGIVSVR